MILSLVDYGPLNNRPVMSWNRWPLLRDQTMIQLHDRHAPLPALPRSFIAYGNGRSYGDVCLNEGGFLLATRRLDKFMAFDRDSGRLCCEAGLLLDRILDLTVSSGWFLPVTPGTRYVTLGGAIANDVHGKNHHVAGSFGEHVLRLALRRSDGRLLVCSRDEEPAWFAATIGGLGLTGVILWAEIQLLRVESEMMSVRTARFHHLDEFWDLNDRASAAWPYTVAWIDCLSASKTGRGRGVLFCGRHALQAAGPGARKQRTWRIGVDLPFSLIRPMSARVFNALYFHKQRQKQRDSHESCTHFLPFFYPLDGVLDWNRLYGRRGFFQYQCVLPHSEARDALSSLLERTARSRETPFLGVLKSFGDSRPAGLLSFTRPGVTLAVDFPNRGASTERLLSDLDSIVFDAGGALYPAKDARMPARLFHAGFPAADEFARYVDPAASSSFWRRVAA